MAEEVHRLLGDAGISSRLDEQHGFDHGMFVPLAIMYPEADIPCVQLSLVNSLDPSDHIAIGKALRELHQENILLIGSGFSFHNLREFFVADTRESCQNNHAFEEWLRDTCCNPAYQEAERTRLLTRWFDAPGARFCHPREEHLLPIHVCYGAGQAACSDSFRLHIMNKKASMYLW
jgi:aromatic ring-opening dioxygenase catalytic subunit (LigB family)